ncbi:MAG: hypothetical protein IIB21_05825 [Chloroflexi bacterium]|nr:hypothetical protein [Chloroflexota bacterium]
MAPPDRLARYGARLLVDWLSERFETQFELSDAQGDAFVASDGEHRIGVYIAPLWDQEAATAWEERLRSMEERLSAGDAGGPFLLWVPPRAGVPVDEPDASDFVQRVREAAASLAPGGRTEVTFPVTVKMGKTREEGGYASVVGALSRWWTRITEKVNGTYHVDSSAVHRLTHDGDAREQLWDTIGRLSLSIEVGQVVDFEVEDAWTLQRLPESEREAGFALVGAPNSADPTEGILVRRMARRRLQAANEALDALDVELRVVGLAGIYEYAELEAAGSMVKALDPSLFNRLQVVCVLVDGEVRPTFLPRALPWAG